MSVPLISYETISIRKYCQIIYFSQRNEECRCNETALNNTIKYFNPFTLALVHFPGF